MSVLGNEMRTSVVHLLLFSGVHWSCSSYWAKVSTAIRTACRCHHCRLFVVMGWDCRLITAALGLLYYPRVIAMWTSE
jgi:hypothetical protein